MHVLLTHSVIVLRLDLGVYISYQISTFDVITLIVCCSFFFFSSRRRHTRYWRDWSSDVCSSDLRFNQPDAGLPAGWLNLVVGSGDSVGNALVNDARIGFYTFTGSVPVGETLKRTIGLRRCTLELGSNSAVIVHEDADVANAATQCALKGFSYAGQVCLSVQRILVHRAVAEEFTTKLVSVTQGLRVGDPKDTTMDIGPMISEGEARRAESWIREAV